MGSSRLVDEWPGMIYTSFRLLSVVSGQLATHPLTTRVLTTHSPTSHAPVHSLSHLPTGQARGRVASVASVASAASCWLALG